MSYTNESQAAGRHILPDLTRAFAVIGIVLVNVAYFAWPGEVTYHDGGLNKSLDHAAYFGVNALFLFKAYTLFSLMFGVGAEIKINVLEIWGLRACKVPPQSGNALQEVCVCVSVSAKGMQCGFAYRFVRFKIVLFFLPRVAVYAAPHAGVRRRKGGVRKCKEKLTLA
jgi:hypothetical protein